MKTKTILLLLVTLMFGRHGIGLLKKPMVLNFEVGNVEVLPNF